jgi:hypothetical protein
LAYSKEKEARLVAVTNHEVKSLMMKGFEEKGESASSFMVNSSIDKIMDFETSRIRAIFNHYNDFVMNYLEQSADEQTQAAFKSLKYAFAETALERLIKSYKNYDTQAIQGFINKDMQPQEDNVAGHTIATSHEQILRKLQQFEIIDEVQAEQRSIYAKTLRI